GRCLQERLDRAVVLREPEQYTGGPGLGLQRMGQDEYDQPPSYSGSAVELQIRRSIAARSIPRRRKDPAGERWHGNLLRTISVGTISVESTAVNDGRIF